MQIKKFQQVYQGKEFIRQPHSSCGDNNMGSKLAGRVVPSYWRVSKEHNS